MSDSKLDIYRKQEPDGGEKPMAESKPEVDSISYGNTFKFPSAGIHGYDEEVEVRDMMVYDEEVLSSATSEDLSRALNKMLGQLTNIKDFGKISVHDRDVLMLYVYTNNYGPMKDLAYTCPHCGKRCEHSIDLTKVEYDLPDERFKGHYSFKPKAIGTEITVRTPTVKDEIAAYDYAMKDKDNKLSVNRLILISSIDFNSPLMTLDAKISAVREKLTAAEFARLVSGFNEATRYGLPKTLDMSCVHEGCGKPYKIPFPFNISDIMSPAISVDPEEFL